MHYMQIYAFYDNCINHSRISIHQFFSFVHKNTLPFGKAYELYII